MEITKEEKQIIELIRKETRDVDYGRVVIEMKIFNNQITNVELEKVRISKNIKK
ncbi:MAG: hypothetical protein ACOC5T_06880 [Elusimicrobiota bacterium]